MPGARPINGRRPKPNKPRLNRMESWLPFFVIVASLAVVVQAVTLAAIYYHLRRQGRRVEQMALELQAKVTPILARIQALVDDVHPQISNMMADAAHITHLARTQVQHADRVVGETIERLRLPVAPAGQITTGGLGTAQDDGG